MINIQNILDSNIEKEPWEHLRVENILQQKTFDLISNECLKISDELEKNPINVNGFWPYELIKMGMSEEIIKVVLDINKCLLDNSQKILNKFNNSNRSIIGYYSIPRFGYTPKNTIEHIHDDDDGDNKALIMVIYMHPLKAPGTKFYTTEDANSFVKEVEWKPNTAMIFSPIRNVTWHSFESDNNPRLTYNFYCEKLEESKIINDYSEEKFEWFYNELPNNKLMVEF